MHKLVLIRHGESEWNKENRFTGWKDVDLSEKGKEEAHAAGKLLKAEGFTFDEAYTSVLKRAIRTLWIILDEMDLMWIPETKSWLLNERHYGALQGLNKAETAAQYGVGVIGRTSELVEEFFAVSVERRITHPCVAAITNAARDRVFA